MLYHEATETSNILIIHLITYDWIQLNDQTTSNIALTKNNIACEVENQERISIENKLNGCIHYTCGMQQQQRHKQRHILTS